MNQEAKTEAGADSPVKVDLGLGDHEVLEIRTPKGYIYVAENGAITYNENGITKIWPNFIKEPIYSTLENEFLQSLSKVVITINGGPN